MTAGGPCTLNLCFVMDLIFIRRKPKSLFFLSTNVVFLPVTKDGAGTGRMVVRPGCCCCWEFNRGTDVFPGGGAASGGMLLGCEKFTPTAGLAPPIAPVPPAYPGILGAVVVVPPSKLSNKFSF